MDALAALRAPVRQAQTPPPYRLLVCDLRSDQVLARLEPEGLSFDDYIGKPGALSATIPVPVQATANLVRESLVPGRTAVYVERGRDIWWGGILWTRTPQSDGRGNLTVDLQAATFDSYFEHRLLFDSYIAEQVDQLDIARQLLDYAQGQDGGDIGILYEPDVSGVLRDRTYLRYDLSTIRELLDNLSQVENGFEWRMRAYRATDGSRVRELQLGYPRIELGATDIMLTKPGNVLSWSLPEDATGRANQWQSRGASVNDNLAADSYPLMSARYIVTIDGQPTTDLGWPLLDGTSDYPTVEEQDTIDAHAREDIIRAWSQHTIPSVNVRLDGTVTPALLGSRARLRIRDLWHPDGLDERYRIVGMRVQPPERGQAETADLYLEAL